MSIVSKWFRGKRNKPRRSIRKLKVIGFTSLNAIHYRMTNWQNSQWMRSGGPALRSEDAQFVSATYYVNLERK